MSPYEQFVHVLWGIGALREILPLQDPQAPLSADQTLAVTNASPHPALSILLLLPGKDIQVPAIVDSGACSCFMDSTVAAKHRIPLLLYYPNPRTSYTSC